VTAEIRNFKTTDSKEIVIEKEENLIDIPAAG